MDTRERTPATGFAIPVAHPSMTFDEASAAVVDYLKTTLPMDLWAVTRFDGDDQVFLTARDDSYGIERGASVPLDASLCVQMVSGRAPHIAPDAMAVPAYAAAPAAQSYPIGSYIGLPIQRPDGELFGSLCGFDPEPLPESVAQHEPLLRLLAALLSTILHTDSLRIETERAAERIELAADSDPLTGLLNRRGWERSVEHELPRLGHAGDAGALIVVDLDGLKRINDTAGHAAGDDYIRRAGTAIRSSVRVTDVAARIGGDEFGIIAFNSTVGQTDQLVRRLRAAFAGADVAASIGHAPITIAGGFDAAFFAADRAMYADKAQRRDAG